MKQTELAAAAILLASTVSFGLIMAPVLRDGLHADDYTDRDLGADPFQEWVGVTVAMLLSALVLDGSARWLDHYRRTGQMMSPEELQQAYE